MIVIVLIGSLFVIGIFSLAMDTILCRPSYHKAISTPKYHESFQNKHNFGNLKITLNNKEDSYTIL